MPDQLRMPPGLDPNNKLSALCQQRLRAVLSRMDEILGIYSQHKNVAGYIYSEYIVPTLRGTGRGGGVIGTVLQLSGMGIKPIVLRSFRIFEQCRTKPMLFLHYKIKIFGRVVWEHHLKLWVYRHLLHIPRLHFHRQRQMFVGVIDYSTIVRPSCTITR